MRQESMEKTPDYWEKVRRAAKIIVDNGRAMLGNRKAPPDEVLESAVITAFHQEYEEIPKETIHDILDEAERLLNK